MSIGHVIVWGMTLVAMVVALRWVSSELTAWSALARRFPTTNTPLRPPGTRALPGCAFALRAGPGPVRRFSHEQSPIEGLSATSDGLQLQSGWLYGWRTRRALVPWREIQWLAHRRHHGVDSFELRVAPGAYLHVDAKAFGEIREFLPLQSAS